MQGWSCHRAGIRAGAGFAAFALTAAVIVTGAGDALASSPVWKTQASVNVTLPGGQIEAISCSAANACTAVGTDLNTSGINVILAERWNGSTWQRQPTPDPAEDTLPAVAPDLLGVSCPAKSFCEAVGQYLLGTTEIGMAESWNGRGWTWQPFPFPVAAAGSAGMGQVSCASARFCEAVGSYQGVAGTQPLAAVWNGTSWRLQYPPAPAGAQFEQFDAVSCASPTFCEAWGGGNAGNPGPTIAERWDGKSWHMQTVPSNTTVDSVSCVSARFCEAVGSSAGVADADVWNGSSWRAQTMPGPGGTLAGVSCAATAFCEAVGEYFSNGNVLGQAAVWNGKAWSAQVPPNPATAGVTDLNAVSCVSASACEAGGDSRAAQGDPPRALAEAWNGHSWRLRSVVAPLGATSNSLRDVSCVSAAFCEAVGSHSDNAGNTVNLAEIWNGTSWTVQATPSPLNEFGPTSDQLTSISCVSTQFCEAVGPASAEVWNGTSWQVQTTPAGAVTPTSVSCATVDFCMTVNGFGQVVIWNGTAWSVGPKVTGFSQVASVSCLSASFCEAVGEGPSGENAAVWNGTSWSAQPTAGPAGVVLNAVTCPAVNSCEAVGAVYGLGNPVTLAETWNGSTWTVQLTPNPSVSQGSVFNSVSCVSASSCTAVGQYQFSNLGLSDTLAEVWNGTTWSLRSTPSNINAGQNILSGVSCVTGPACVAVGQTADLGLVQSTLIEAGD